MFCSGCGQALASDQGICPQCGRPVVQPGPFVPGAAFQVQQYAGKIKALSVVWYIYAGFSLLTSLAGLAFAHALFSGCFAPWMHGPWANGPMPPWIFGPAILHIALVFLVLRVALAVAAGWGLMERSSWGRIVAIIAAILNVLKFPLGTALAIWTLVVLLGYRNGTLYDQLET